MHAFYSELYSGSVEMCLLVEGVMNNCGIQTKECSLTACELISGRADRWLIHLKVIVHSSVVGHVCCVRE